MNMHNQIRIGGQVGVLSNRPRMYALPNRRGESSTSGFSRSQNSKIRPTWMQQNKKKTKKVKLSMWEHEFVCLADCNKSSPPTTMERVDLIRAGLGPKKIPFFVDGEAFDFHDELLLGFPKLAKGGGYELLRTLPSNSREFFVIPPDGAGYTVKYLKPIVNQAKVFVRPMQKDLDLTPMRPNKVELVLFVLFNVHACVYTFII